MNDTTTATNRLGVTAMSSAAAAASFNQLEEHYYDITSLYDLAEALVETVECKAQQNPEAQLAIIEPLVDELTEAADILTEEYIAVLEGNKPRKANKKIEVALRRIYMAIDAYHTRADAAVSLAAGGVRNLADSIVKKITRQMEVIVAALIDFVDLSLGRIMSSSYAEELRQRQEKIALMLHSIGQGAS